MKVFPKDFFWGAALSAYQAEGNNVNSDWWAWEKSRNALNHSQDACRHYQLYKDDFDLAKQLNHNCHRLSVEWSRIQPQQDEFSSQELAHYREVILALKERGIEPLVTLHHFSNPIWFAEAGGWQSLEAVDYFLSFTEKIVETLADQVTYWITINEPMVYAYYSYLSGDWPPQEKSASKFKQVVDNFIAAHIKAYGLIRDIYRKKNLAAPKISLAQNVIAFVACKDSLRNRLAVYLRNNIFNFRLIKKFIRHRTLDFIGLNYYTRHLIDTRSWSVKELLTETCKSGHNNLAKNSLGWEVYPQGLYDLLRGLKKYKREIFILENGISTDDDRKRWDYIRAHLEKIHQAIQDGVNVRAYVYWSLLDNFEWDKGFSPRFGLIDLDYRTYQRSVRDSGRKFSEVCKTGRID